MKHKSTKEMLGFISASPSPYHVIDNLKKLLEEDGFSELQESQKWKLAFGGKYYVTRNGSSMIAFQVPENPWYGFQISAAHSDCPAFKIKENAEIEADKHYVSLNVEKYGGMLYAPWLDRPLSVAGRIQISEEDKVVNKLVDMERDLVLIPNVAIHMNREANKSLSYNPQIDLSPLLGSEEAKGGFLKLIAKKADVSPESILSTDLFLYNRQKGSIWGAKEEFVSSRALDDLQCVFGTIQGFRKARNKNRITMCCVFDNEEVGSGTKQGADSTMLSDTLERISENFCCSREDYLIALANSFFVSADNGHAVHPNHAEKTDPTNRAYMNGGVVIKYNGNQKYTTDSVSAALFKRICENAKVPVQSFVNRSDMAGGSTLGNIASSHISINMVDIGLAQLSMHSSYETAGVKDTDYLIDAMETFFRTSVSKDEEGNYMLQE